MDEFDLEEFLEIDQAYSPYMSIGRTPPMKRALYRNQEDSVNSTVYQEFPANKPFINDDFRRSPSKPITAFPESNRQAVISALKNLQEKIRKLEIERTSAEDNLKSLASETNKYKNILQQDQDKKHATQSMVSKHTQELESQLTSAEGRCDLLEKQLDYMRKMVQSAENERQDAISKQSLLERQREETGPNLKSHLEKINELEREHLKLTATQSLAENKIRELEDRLKEERQQRKLLQEKAEEREPEDLFTRLIPEPSILLSKPTMKSKKIAKKKKKVIAKKTRPSCSDPTKHYRVNLAEIPFVAGKSSTRSHSVGANVQKVLAMLKTHNTDLCSAASGQVPVFRESSPSSGSYSPTLDSDLADLLLQLQDEFGQMSFEHRELSNQINEAISQTERDDLERELEFLVNRMEAKSQQISKIRQHQMKMEERKRKKATRKTKDPPPHPLSALAYTARGDELYTNSQNGEVEVTTTIKTKGTGSGVIRIRPSSAREVSLNVLKDMKRLQTTLRKDDLSWE